MRDTQKMNMYCQFEAPPCGHVFLRFVWYNDEGEVMDYRMNVHVFGATSSLSWADYGYTRLATDCSKKYNKAADFLLNNLYVDMD